MLARRRTTEVLIATCLEDNSSIAQPAIHINNVAERS
jgi:hypothetical protein